MQEQLLNFKVFTNCPYGNSRNCRPFSRCYFHYDLEAEWNIFGDASKNNQTILFCKVVLLTGFVRIAIIQLTNLLKCATYTHVC